MIRTKKNRRIKATKLFTTEMLGLESDDEARLVSSWRPYISTVGTAEATGVTGLITPSNL